MHYLVTSEIDFRLSEAVTICTRKLELELELDELLGLSASVLAGGISGKTQYSLVRGNPRSEEKPNFGHQTPPHNGYIPFTGAGAMPAFGCNARWLIWT